METDYRKLCLELFGTDSVDELRLIAGRIKNKNVRNAGRKRKFTQADIEDISRLRNEGMSLQTIADKYGTSRQLVGKYLTEPPEKGTTMRITYMFRQHPCTVIDVNFLNRKIKIQNMTNDLIHRAFGVIENPTWEDFNYFLEDRCFPRTRGNCKELLQELGLTDYDPLQIVEKTHGRLVDDELWMKIRYMERERQ